MWEIWPDCKFSIFFLSTDGLRFFSSSDWLKMPSMKSNEVLGLLGTPKKKFLLNSNSKGGKIWCIKEEITNYLLNKCYNTTLNFIYTVTKGPRMPVLLFFALYWSILEICGKNRRHLCSGDAHSSFSFGETRRCFIMLMDSWNILCIWIDSD